jgi:F420-dependent oxidoreductase-like protein
MRIGMALNYSGGFKEAVAELGDYEKAGLDIVYVAEAYSFDAVSQLGYIAAKTERLEIASGILNIYSRTPSLLAMTAAGVDYVSDGRFTLGLGASGPQVIEGFHGVPYHAPLGRTREVVEICRKIWKREERLSYDGRYYTLPLPAEQGTGLGKPLKIINHPVRSDIPILLASIGPKNVELTAEIADGWEPIFYLPEKADDVWGASLAAGKAKRDPSLGELDIVGQAALAIGDDVEGLLEFGRPNAALYIGGMGAKGKNFYNDLCRRYGWEREAELIQDLYLEGKKDEAAQHVPYELLQKMSLIGTEGYVKERLAAMKAAGVTTLNVTPIAGDHAARLKLVEKVKELATDV